MLLNIIKELKLEKKVFLMGWQSKVDANYHKAKLFVLPSVYEGLGNVLIDAINHSVPCIATNCKSGPKEILDNGKNGLIFKSNNSESLIENIILFEKLSNNELKVLKINAKKKSKEFTIFNHFKSFQRIIS